MLKHFAFLSGLLVAAWLIAGRPCRAQEDRYNVLFIPIDDLNHWVGHLSVHPQARTPHLDRLAASGLSFRRAYCAAPACNPSRIALMSGMRPSTTGCYDNSQDWRPAVDTGHLLNTTFLRHGFEAFGAGKIYHGSYGNTDQWTEFFGRGGGQPARHPAAKNDGVGGIRFFPLAGEDSEMPDYRNVSYAIEQLNRKHEKPFFLAVGLVKPHMPFSVPKKWFDRFPLESIELPPHIVDDLSDVPAAGVAMARPEGDHAKILASGRWREAVQAYLATIAFADAQVGRLLDALEASDYADNTIVCLWSDHGWSLGEKEHWRKFALWEEPTRTVFIWRVPGMTPRGEICDHPVDLMSIYPTLCSLTGIPRPDHVEGLDLTPLLKDPRREWAPPALTTFRRQNHAVRDATWRYIRYADGSEELYNHNTDPNEWTNLAGDARYEPVKRRLAEFLPEKNAEELPTSR